MPLSSGYPDTPAPQCDCPEDCYLGDGGDPGNEGGGNDDPSQPQDPQSPGDGPETPGGGGDDGQDKNRDRPPLVSGPDGDNGGKDDKPKMIICYPPEVGPPWYATKASDRLRIFSNPPQRAARGTTGGIRVGTGMPMVNNSLCSQTGAAFNIPFGTKTTYDSQGSTAGNAFGNNWISQGLRI